MARRGLHGRRHAVAVHHLVDEGLAVERVGDRLAEVRVGEDLRLGGIVLAEVVEGDVAVAAAVVGLQLALGAVGLELLVGLRHGDAVEVELAVVEHVALGAGVGEHEDAHLVELDGVGVPVVGVLLQHDLVLVLPAVEQERAVGGEGAGVRAVGVAVLLHEVGARGRGQRRGGEAEEVGGRAVEPDDERLVVGRGDAEFLGLLRGLADGGAVLDDVVDLAEAGADEEPLEGGDEIAGDDRLAVGPVRLAQMEGVGHAVGARPPSSPPPPARSPSRASGPAGRRSRSARTGGWSRCGRAGRGCRGRSRPAGRRSAPSARRPEGRRRSRGRRPDGDGGRPVSKMSHELTPLLVFFLSRSGGSRSAAGRGCGSRRGRRGRAPRCRGGAAPRPTPAPALRCRAP